jgi:hypothetical protein
METLGGPAAGYFDPDQGNWFDRRDVTRGLRCRLRRLAKTRVLPFSIEIRVYT